MTEEHVDVKSRILLAARKLFARQGFDRTTNRQICEEANANIALISYHFGGKEKVFSAIFDSMYEENSLQHLANNIDHPIETMRAIIYEVTKYRYKNPEVISILQQEIMTNSPRMKFIQQKVLPIWLLLREALIRGKEAQIFHFQSLDNTLFFILGAILFHRDNQYFAPLLTEKERPFEELWMEQYRFIMRGLGVSEEELEKNLP